MNWKQFIEEIEEGLFGRRFSDTELAQLLKVSTVAINKIRNGATVSPQSDTIGKFEDAFNIRIYHASGGITFQSKNENGIKINKYPIIHKLLGDALIFKMENITDYVALPYKKVEGCFAMKATENLPPKIDVGDIILADMGASIYSADIVIVKLKDDRQLIKYYREWNENLAILYDSMKPFIVQREEISIVYKMVGVWKQL